MEPLTLSVSELVSFTNQTLEGAYPTVVVEGEVASYKESQGKYVFFDLKDNTASVGCFLSLYGLRMQLEDGMKVVVLARPRLTNWGKFSLTVLNMRPKGEGTIKKSFELLKKKMVSEGLFDKARKRSLPEQIQRVALISSTDAAGYADFIKILNERWGGLEVEVAHVQVQGLEAPDQIIQAIKYFNQKQNLADVLVIVRGGGSSQDLSAFNDELLVREIVASRIPVLTGIGHETDESLADLAADAVASTPSNAAQMITPDKQALLGYLKSEAERIDTRIKSEIEALVAETRNETNRLEKFIVDRIDSKLLETQNLARMAAQLNPENVLRQGYALVVGELKTGNVVDITTLDKKIKAEVLGAKKR
ncbi:MAG: exodeoxyribonuclease VII large subunit [Candidatus Nomurabacteria bacterium]|jgi:exodeoxyribonuclease VII large subunit|nr:exodeoxyribonuclease VII large subunit [Candidatus Nomurabacteria bacterium]